MYPYEERIRALQQYQETGSIQKTIRALGYPGRQTLYRWIQEREQPQREKSANRGRNTPEHPRHPTVEIKLEALHRCFELGEDVKSVADEIGYSRASIYVWRRKYLRKGMIALMNPKDDPRGELKPGNSSSSEEINQLKAQLQDMQMEIDILRETIDVLKKDPGIDRTALKNREKAAIIDALKNKYSLPKLLLGLRISKSSYYYHQKVIRQADKYAFARSRIREIFEENHCCYGYRRIYHSLKREGFRLSEKVIRRLMKESGLYVMTKKKKAYSSYRGEITPAVPNIIQRNFHASKPNEKWLTDITEFAIPAGKIYFSPMIDCFDGMPICWSVGTAPDASLVNGMLDEAISQLKEDEHPIIHTDRGCHYRWPGWINRMNAALLRRSMSKKGCSPDNSACEGFFGRMKNEMFYGLSWANVSIDDFIRRVNDYMTWYREKRIKVSLGGMSLTEHRRSFGLHA